MNRKNLNQSGYISIILIIGLALLAGLTVWYLRQQVDVSPVHTIHWNQTSITDQEGRELVSIDDFSDEIEVSPGESFGSSAAISEAKLSPDTNWIAIGIKGAAHDFGWLYNVPLDNIVPVAFQFDGGVEPISWSPSSEYIVFKITSPGDFTRLKLVKTTEVNEYPSTTGFTVKAPIEDELPPEDISYKVIEWRDNDLCFKANETEYCIDPDSQNVEKL